MTDNGGVLAISNPAHRPSQIAGRRR